MLPRRHDGSNILTERVKLKNLGKLTFVDSAILEPGHVLWDRFCVIGEPRRFGDQLIVTITDLEKDPERSLGTTLELHQIPAPGPSERARWLRALSVNNRMQAHVRAYADVGDGFIAVLCEPAVGTPLALDDDGGLVLRGRELQVFALELSNLLASLHQVGGHGVRFSLDRLRVLDGHFHVDGFAHLQLEDDGRDLEALVDLIRQVGRDAATPLIEPTPANALELWRRLRAQGDLQNVSGLLTPEPPFVGRGDALSSLRQGFDQAQIAKATIIVVQGPRGVGKSRLLREFAAERLRNNDSLVLTGAWERDSANIRNGVPGALELLPRALARFSEAERDDIRMRIEYATRGVAALVTRSAPSLETILRHAEELPPLDLGEDFTRHTATIAELLRSLGTSKRPLVMILDNLESADAASIKMLDILAEPQPAHHSLILLGLRSDGVQSPLELVTETIGLSPLGHEEIVELLSQTLDDGVEDIESIATTLRSGSGGLPLAIWAGLRSWLDRGYLNRSAADGIWRLRIPSNVEEQTGVRALFGPRLASLSPAMKRFALHTAVLGTTITDDELRYLGRLLDVDHLEATEELIKLGILIATVGGVRSPHSSIREFVMESFDAADRRVAHDAIATMLTERQAPIAQIAYHRDLAFDARCEDAAASDRLSRLHVDAGRERLSVYDLERARWHLEHALDYSRDSKQRTVAAEGLADVCLLLKDLDTAISLYTAIIATDDSIRSVQVAGKVTQFLFFTSAFKSGRALGAMAFEQVGEPTRKSPLGNLALFLGSALRNWLGIRPKRDAQMRDAIVRVHLWVAQMCFVDDPLALLGHVARASWLSRGLESGPAAMLKSLAALLWATIAGRHEHANELYKEALEIATVKNRDFWSEAYVRHNWALHLFSSNNYEKGQDMADDTIGAFREAGDVSPTSVTIMFKSLYGRDHEPADRLLRWLDEAILASKRNGKTFCLVPLEVLKVHVLARQNPEAVKPRLPEISEMVDCEETAGERLVGRTHLTFAAYECGEWELGRKQVIKAIADIADGPGVPEFCQDFYLAAAFVLMELPNPTREDRKLYQSVLKKFRRFASRSPRLAHYNDLLNLKIAVKARNTQKVQAIASKIVAEIEVHNNLYMAHHAHRELSIVLKGEKVLEAAQHERIAREYGRRIGLGDFTLSAFAEVQDELAERGFALEATGGDTATATAALSEAQADVLEAWAVSRPAETPLGAILEPVREAASSSFRADELTLTCSDPEMTVPIESGTLQVLVITMLRVCQDTLDTGAQFKVQLEDKQFAPGDSFERFKDLDAGRYLMVRVSARGTVVSMLSGFKTCENLVANLGGRLTASTDKTSVAFVALIPLEGETVEADKAPLAASVIVHPDPGVRAQLGAALDELGAQWRAFEPDEFSPANIEQARIVFAHSRTLDDLVVLGPLLSAQLIEIVAEGEEPSYYDQEQLTLPPEAAKLEVLLRK